MKMNTNFLVTLAGGALVAGSMLFAGPASAQTTDPNTAPSSSHAAIGENGVLDWIESSAPQQNHATTTPPR
ncbi:hypothetical protein ACRDU6_25435 [Mycolicibacterium sp. ELW1]|uniref:hypothetical protein n=1 Tax=Mycobacteriaceae TaxID=1762 RepID=UPI0011EF6F18|nr:hypothetical protein [Mycobacterium sp. ELW1]QEN15581.1 hypothetical protein D3H54_21950 [Mycobacterium sp. ELW1]